MWYIKRIQVVSCRVNRLLRRYPGHRTFLQFSSKVIIKLLIHSEIFEKVDDPVVLVMVALTLKNLIGRPNGPTFQDLNSYSSSTF